jgi:predicted nucleotidyltransferase
MDTISGLRTTVTPLLDDAGVRFSYLFGSRAGGRATEESDVDIAVAFDPSTTPEARADRLLRLGVRLERALQTPVDLVDLADAPLRLAGRIVTERIVLTGHDEPDRVSFEEQVLPRYFDVRYHADRLDRLLLDAMASGRR